MLKIDMGHLFKKGRRLSSNLPFGSKKLKMEENVEAQKKMTFLFFFKTKHSEDA